MKSRYIRLCYALVSFLVVGFMLLVIDQWVSNIESYEALKQQSTAQQATIDLQDAKLADSKRENRQLGGSIIAMQLELEYSQESVIHFSDASKKERIKAEQYQQLSILLAAEAETLSAELEKHQRANRQLVQQASVMQHSFALAKQMIQDAQNLADQIMIECMEMHIAGT